MKEESKPMSVSTNPKADVNLVVINGNVVNLKEHMPEHPACKWNRPFGEASPKYRAKAEAALQQIAKI